MTKSLSTLPFVATTDPNQWIAAVNVDTSVDTVWQFNLQNAYDNGGNVLAPKFVLVDNLQNNGIVGVEFGAYNLSVPQFSRKTFQIPGGTQSLQINASVGVVPVYFTTETPGIPDDVNQYQVNAALAPKAVFTPKTIVASQAQATADLNCYIEFSSASQITYALMTASTVTPGFYNPRLMNNGSAPVLIAPQNNGLDSVNGFYHWANPLILQPGASVDLFCDGSNAWQAHGTLRWESPELPAASLQTSGEASLGSHFFGVAPDVVNLFLRNKIAELGYTVGQEVQLAYTGGSGATFSGVVPSWDSGQIYATRGSSIVLPNFSTGGNGAGITVANWSIVARAHRQI